MLIGLHGKARTGKDTSCRFLQEYGASIGDPVRREGFADRLKLSAARALGFKGDLEAAVAFCNELKQPGIYIEVLSERGLGEVALASLTGREYLQYYGTEAHREVFDTDFWIDAVMATYDPEEVLVVTDVRFENEAAAIQAGGGEVWHIVRPDGGIVESSHASEKALPPEMIDRTIINDLDLDHLRHLVVCALTDAWSERGVLIG